jgi:hypothetical protein
VLIRFLQTTPSQASEYPFQAGQEIALADLTPEVVAWIQEGRAVIVSEAPEAAVVAPSERAVRPSAKARRVQD